MVDRKRRLDCANGIRKADIVLKHGKVLNVFTEEILEADVRRYDRGSRFLRG